MKYRDKYTGLFIIKFILFIASFGLFIAATLNSHEILNFKINGYRAEGIVTNVEKRPSGGYEYWHHTIEYSVNNIKYKAEQNYNSGFNPSHSVNEKVTVIYLKDNPSQSKIDTNNEIYFLPIEIFVLALAFFFSGFLIHKYPKKISELMNNN